MKLRFPFAATAAALLFLTSSGVSPENTISADGEGNTLIFSSNFESDTQGWTPLGTGKLSLDKNNSYEGSQSLHIAERVQSWNGPSIELVDVLTPSDTPHFSGWIYQESGATEEITITVKNTNSNGNAAYNNIISISVPSGEWVKAECDFEVPQDIVSAVLYVESPNATLEYSIDNFEITGTGTRVEPSSGSGSESSDTGSKEDTANPAVTQPSVIDGELPKFVYNFESGFENWTARGDGSVRVMRTDEYSSSGQFSLFITDRNAIWNGATVDIDTIPRGISYNYSASILYNGKYSDSHPFYIQLQYELDGNAVYELIAEKEIPKNTWTKIDGTYVLPAGARKVQFYIQTANNDSGELTTDDLMSFYIDQIVIEDSTAAVLHKRMAVIAIAAGVAAALIILILVVLGIIRKSKRTKAALRLAATDAMTHAFNRNAYEEHLEELEESQEDLREAHFALCDVNFLKYLNDNYGHEKGDEAIIRCAELLMNAVGNNGKVYRTGGDEFMCITEEPMEKEIARAIQTEMAIDNGYPFAVAVGFSSYDPVIDGENASLKAMIKRCDNDMYENKQKIKAENKEFTRDTKKSSDDEESQNQSSKKAKKQKKAQESKKPLKIKSELPKKSQSDVNDLIDGFDEDFDSFEINSDAKVPDYDEDDEF